MKYILRFITILLLTIGVFILEILYLFWSLDFSAVFDTYVSKGRYFKFYSFQNESKYYDYRRVKFKTFYHFLWGFDPIEVSEYDFNGWVDYKTHLTEKINEKVVDDTLDIYRGDGILKHDSSMIRSDGEWVECGTLHKPDVLKSLVREYENMEKRGWDRIFLMFDLHGTVIVPNREVGNTEIVYYPYAKETLQLISNRSDLDLNIYTCSHEEEVKEYQRKFKEDGIIFKYVNENPDVKTNGYGNYDKKPYMNVLFEDKSGWDPDGWIHVYNFFKEKYKE